MKFDKVALPYAVAYILPIGDTHIGDKNFNQPLLESNIKWVDEQENARVVLTGDILNVATRRSASSPAEQNLNLSEQIEVAVNLLRPIKDKIIGGIDGNHENRLIDDTGFSPLSTVCGVLGTKYYGSSVVLSVVVGTGKRTNLSPNGKVAYWGYFHHTTGGGGTVGGKINRVEKLRRLVANCDFYVGSHNHQLGVVPVETRIVDTRHDKVIKVRQLLIDSGSYLNWDNSYAERGQLEPSKLGSPRIRLSGEDKDVHCSI